MAAVAPTVPLMTLRRDSLRCSSVSKSVMSFSPCCWKVALGRSALGSFLVRARQDVSGPFAVARVRTAAWVVQLALHHPGRLEDVDQPVAVLPPCWTWARLVPHAGAQVVPQRLVAQA